jgi:hypothetical protein
VVAEAVWVGRAHVQAAYARVVEAGGALWVMMLQCVVAGAGGGGAL